CEISEGRLAPVATEALGAGSRLATALGQELSAVLIGAGVGEAAQEAIAFGAAKVYVVDAPSLQDYATEPYLQALEAVVRQSSPAIVLLGQTPMGRDLAPWLALRLNTGATMDCMALEIDPDTKRLLMTRPVYGGNAQAVQSCSTDPQVATVRLKAMTPAERDDARQGQVIDVTAAFEAPASKAQTRERKIEPETGIKLDEARVIVAGGRGIGGGAGFQQLGELAARLGGAVGATRPPCDAKWAADSQQIGITGKIVSPDLYVAVAISGASQHVSGCSSSKVIVAINKDPDANIFRVADYGIVDDWKAVVPALISALA
ncbi:MAG: electron transfer flavoprotein subunit alpha/FixB family protein, partial [Thermoleophilia bacterium]|nr:electron transfer flavoprotein subunit alpha/FixB family protein [Thermoleophilia bacterium]